MKWTRTTKLVKTAVYNMDVRRVVLDTATNYDKIEISGGNEDNRLSYSANL